MEGENIGGVKMGGGGDGGGGGRGGAGCTSCVLVVT